MLDPQRKHRCYNSACIDAALEARNRGHRTGTRGWPPPSQYAPGPTSATKHAFAASRTCPSLLNDCSRDSPEDAKKEWIDLWGSADKFL